MRDDRSCSHSGDPGTVSPPIGIPSEARAAQHQPCSASDLGNPLMTLKGMNLETVKRASL